MRDRLIELIEKWYEATPPKPKYLADYLLENGVIAPPCKVGDKAYFIIEDIGETYISEEPIVDVSAKGFFVDGDGEANPYSDVGTTVFFDRAEAEKALKKQEE